MAAPILPATNAPTVVGGAGVGRSQRREDDDCSICREGIVPSEFSLIKGCEHTYCCSCILSWCAFQDQRTHTRAQHWCPLCRTPFNYLYTYRQLDGTFSDFLVEEPLVLLQRATWFDASKWSASHIATVEERLIADTSIFEPDEARHFYDDEAFEHLAYDEYANEYVNSLSRPTRAHGSSSRGSGSSGGSGRRAQRHGTRHGAAQTPPPPARSSQPSSGGPLVHSASVGDIPLANVSGSKTPVSANMNSAKAKRLAKAELKQDKEAKKMQARRAQREQEAKQAADRRAAQEEEHAAQALQLQLEQQQQQILALQLVGVEQ
jgi:hypothetical protein